MAQTRASVLGMEERKKKMMAAVFCAVGISPSVVS